MYSWLQLLPFHHFKYTMPFPSDYCRVSVEKSADSLDESFLVICHFPLAAFNILSLSLLFVSLVTTCLGVFLLGFIPPGTFCASWTWLTIPFPILGKFSPIISSNIFSSFLSLFYPYNANGHAFSAIPEVS